MLDTKQILIFAVIGLAALNVLFCISALALNNWYEDPVVGFSYGLWKECNSVSDSVSVSSKCFLISKASGWLEAVLNFVFIGLFAMIGATVTHVMHTFIMKDKSVLVYLTIVLSVVAGVFMISAFAIYAVKSSVYDHGAGFDLCITKWLLARPLQDSVLLPCV